ncbi:hypothetical protein RclHR1_10970001 [Rhizophagus clarus]|uniref:Uncharacterized protein n=1 Tax=Rhizophagus clarus TaxID=94130 RepID=A0A2Z6Q2Y9_9GLOM|nr:hypothetical protein RclHR1_10970001 [Rhizophagus clarus]
MVCLSFYRKLTFRLEILAISFSDSWRMNKEHIGSWRFSSFSWDRLDIGDSVVIILKVWTWILIISQVSDEIPARKFGSTETR